nr:dna replication complex gins protein psf3 [Quercus suber]
MTYYSPASILTDAQKAPTTFSLAVPNLTPLNNGSTVNQGTKIDLPLWMAEMLAVSKPAGPSSNSLATLDMPSPLGLRVLNALRADPKSVDLRAQAQWFYGLGERMLELFEEEEVGTVLSDSFKARAQEIADRAQNTRGSSQQSGDNNEIMRGLDESERSCESDAHKSSLCRHVKITNEWDCSVSSSARRISGRQEVPSFRHACLIGDSLDRRLDQTREAVTLHRHNHESTLTTLQYRIVVFASYCGTRNSPRSAPAVLDQLLSIQTNFLRQSCVMDLMLTSSYSDEDIEFLMQTLPTGDEHADTAQTSAEKGCSRSKSALGSGDKSAVADSKKFWLYKNARLPPGMVPFKCYVPTWTLVCRAARAALEVYEEKVSSQREIFVGADPKAKTKAMIIKAQPVDDRCLIVIAIRGSQVNKFDWTTNLRWQPTQPTGFLDDEGNACHGGFLDVAKQMVHPVAEQLEKTFEQDPSLAGNCSLVFTGHSAGGAVASLLFSHMLSKRIQTKLTDIAGSGFIRRIHCGDPVVRMDNRNYVLSLAKLMATPAPPSIKTTKSTSLTGSNNLRSKFSRHNLRSDAVSSSSATTSVPLSSASRAVQLPYWPVPPATLSNAGRIILLREKPYDHARRTEAVVVSDEQLRHVIFGDRAMHSMNLYQSRVDELAFATMSGT